MGLSATVGIGLKVTVEVGWVVTVGIEVEGDSVPVAKAVPGGFSGQNTQAAAIRPMSARMSSQRLLNLGLLSTE